MGIRYDELRKDLPCDQLLRLFRLAGWSGGSETAYQKEHFNAPFLHSEYVVSAWDGEKLAGVARLLSDTVVRSVLYDLVVDPEYRGRGIGSELVRLCAARYPMAELLLETEEPIAGFYERLGFRRYGEVVLYIPSKLFKNAIPGQASDPQSVV